MMISSELHYRFRKIRNAVAMIASVVAISIGLFWMGCILWTLFAKGFQFLDLKLFREMTPPPGESGGLLNAIIGSLLMTSVATVIGTVTGILAGTFISEFGRASRTAAFVRFINEILLSAPSVVIGFFIYALVVLKMGHFSGLAGTLALSVIFIPIVTTSTENVLGLVPRSLREAGAALGVAQWKVTLMIVYQAARPGILTGILLAVARISGETAPLLFTALNNQFWNSNLLKPMANLPVVIFQFAMSPYRDWQQLAWAGALLITFGVLALNIIARVFLRARNAK